MMTSSRPCFFHSSRMYSASSLLRLDPAIWGSWVKMRCWRRSSSGVGMDLNFFSTSDSWAEEAGVKPRIGVWAFAAVENRAMSERSAVRLWGMDSLDEPHTCYQGLRVVCHPERRRSRREGPYVGQKLRCGERECPRRMQLAEPLPLHGLFRGFVRSLGGLPPSSG